MLKKLLPLFLLVVLVFTLSTIPVWGATSSPQVAKIALITQLRAQLISLLQQLLSQLVLELNQALTLGGQTSSSSPLLGNSALSSRSGGGGGGGGNSNSSSYYTISALVGAGGIISPIGNVLVASGANQSFAFSPFSGYQLSQVLVDGQVVPTTSNYTFSKVKKDHSIKVTFSTTPAPVPMSEPTPETKPNPTPDPTPSTASSCSSITQYGITWTFDKSYSCGQFVLGDWWVVGPVKVTGISPNPIYTSTKVRNGYMVNPAGSVSGHAFDDRANQYKSSLNPSPLPLNLSVNSSLVSTISNPEVTTCFTAGKAPGWTRRNGGCSAAKLWKSAVLTVLPSAAPSGSFRPAFAGTSKNVYSSTNLRRDLTNLNLPVPTTLPNLTLIKEKVKYIFPDIVVGWSSSFTKPIDNLWGGYGADFAAETGEIALLTLTNISEADKEVLRLGLVQLGIDLHGILKSGGYWPADGGHAPGRKLPILYAGLLLNNSEMLSIGTAYPPNSNKFGEDCQTYYDSPEIPNYSGVPGLPKWGIRHCQDLNYTRPEWHGQDGYRLLNAEAWVGQALTARLLGLEKIWNNQAYFDYEDRYSQEGGGGTHGSGFSRAMWNTYRRTVKTCINQVQDRCSINCNETNKVMTGETGTDTGGACSLNYVCTEAWSCTAWSSCSSGSQARTCNDINRCGTNATKPAETQSCNLSTGSSSSGGNGLILHYPFEGDTSDASGNGNFGTPYGGPSHSSGKAGLGIVFDGSNDYVNVPSNLGITDYPFTFSAWVSTQNPIASTTGVIVSNAITSDATRMSLLGIDNATGKAFIGSTNLATSRKYSINPISDGAWHHLVAVFESTTSKKLYVDGQLQGTLTSNLPLDPQTNVFSVGRISDSTPGAYFKGSVDEVRVYKRALSDSEISQLYQNPTATLSSRSVTAQLASIYEALSRILQNMIPLLGR